jgi:hypothetical protein
MDPTVEKPSGDRSAEAEPQRRATRRLSRRVIWLSGASVLLATVLLTVLLVVWYRYNGAALGRYVTGNFNKTHRGRMAIKSIRWSPGAVLDLVTGGYHKVQVYDVTIYDSRGRVAIQAAFECQPPFDARQGSRYLDGRCPHPCRAGQAFE